MIRVTITPKKRENVYRMLVSKERELRLKNRGTLHRGGAKQKGQDRWTHETYKGWVTLQKCLGGIVVARVQSKTPNEEWQLLTSFVGFLDRHFREAISAINLSYEAE